MCRVCCAVAGLGGAGAGPAEAGRVAGGWGGCSVGWLLVTTAGVAGWEAGCAAVGPGGVHCAAAGPCGVGAGPAEAGVVCGGPADGGWDADGRGVGGAMGGGRAGGMGSGSNPLRALRVFCLCQRSTLLMLILLCRASWARRASCSGVSAGRRPPPDLVSRPTASSSMGGSRHFVGSRPPKQINSCLQNLNRAFAHSLWGLLEPCGIFLILFHCGSIRW